MPEPEGRADDSISRWKIEVSLFASKELSGLLRDTVVDVR